MSFSAGISLFRNLVLKGLGSVFGFDTNVQHYKFQQPGYYDFSAVNFSNYITHILGNPSLEFLQLEWS